MKFFHATGSWGDLAVDADTGDVLEYFVEDDAYGPDDPEGQGYRDITRFDVEEWRRTYPTEKLEGQWIDVLDLGGWLKDGTYFPAEEDWRKEIKQGLYPDAGRQPLNGRR